MKQPELGKKIIELRKQKGLTQEDLAARCYINVRSIQRIEAGEVIPRLSTLNILTEVLDFEFNYEKNEVQDLWIIFLHLTNIIPIVIIAVIIWTWKKGEIPNLNTHGINVINHQITIFICLLISIPFFIPLPLIGIYNLFMTIRNIIKISQNKDYHYPVFYKFIKEV